MPLVSEEVMRDKLQTFIALRNERLSYWGHWRELADYFLPRRYVWLLSEQERKGNTLRNPFILDGTGTLAARVLASGMMNGITSPSRPWFRLRIAGFGDDLDYAARVWLDEVQRRMFLVLSASNFYNALAVMYLDLVVFGTAAMIIYEDYDNVIHCFNPALGEYYLAQDSRHRVNTFARQFTYRVHQLVQEFGVENCSPTVQEKWRRGGSALQDSIDVVHLIEPNNRGYMPQRFPFCEYYWEMRRNDGDQMMMLRTKGYFDFPVLAPRWELTGNDSYGSSPAMDAFGDVVQLQHETKKKGQALDKMVSPPILADVQLAHRPVALLPNGITFVQGNNSVGAKPIYEVRMPIAELTNDIQSVQLRIQETFHNPLFNMISNLETVRSATEIDARREEKLVLLGPVLERFENEALDPAINRVFSIMQRKNLIPPPPPSIHGAPIEIQYVSILAAAQSAVGTASTERMLQIVASIAGLWPKAVNVPDWEEIIRDYSRDIGVPAKQLRDRDVVAADNEQMDNLLKQREQAAQGSALVQGAQTLSQTDVGGGRNALQQILAS